MLRKVIYAGGAVDGTYVCDRVPGSFKDFVESLGFEWVDDGPEGVVFEAPVDTQVDGQQLSVILTQHFADAAWLDEVSGSVLLGHIDVAVEEIDEE